jgi:hypothetical protein
MEIRRGRTGANMILRHVGIGGANIKQTGVWCLQTTYLRSKYEVLCIYAYGQKDPREPHEAQARRLPGRAGLEVGASWLDDRGCLFGEMVW